MKTPCSKYLNTCRHELSYTLWRADIHRQSASEVEQAWQKLNEHLISHCPNGEPTCAELNTLLRNWQPKFDYLYERATKQ